MGGRIWPGVPPATRRRSTCGAGRPLCMPSSGKSRFLHPRLFLLLVSSRPLVLVTMSCRDSPANILHYPSLLSQQSLLSSTHTLGTCCISSTQYLSPSCEAGNVRGDIAPRRPRGASDVHSDRADTTETCYRGDQEKT